MFSNYRQPTDLAVTVKTDKGPNTRNEKFTAIDMASLGFRLSLDRNEAWHMTGHHAGFGLPLHHQHYRGEHFRQSHLTNASRHPHHPVSTG